ncbi:MAG TPA: CBS domain-containing protein [Candidatus Polarisedimenticolia bacterium]|nr:CBS domain-containing protein [Candidatus Polarisedimenticolia bacterium]
MQDKNPNQQRNRDPRRPEEGRQGTGAGTAVREEESWRGEPSRDEERWRQEERSRGYYASALRRMRDRSYHQGPRHDVERWPGYGGMGGYYGGAYEGEWGGHGRYEGGQEGPYREGYGQGGRQPSLYGEQEQQRWGRGEGRSGWRQEGQQREYGREERPGAGWRERGEARHGQVESSRWGGWMAPFSGRGEEQRSGRSERRTRWSREPLTVSDIMTENPQCVRPQSTLREAARVMKDENVGIVPVVDENDRLQGIVTDRDIVVRSLAEDRSGPQMKVEEIMTRDVEAVTADEEVREVLDLMGRKKVRRLPVVDQEDRLTGIVSISDIASKADYHEELQEALERIASRRSFWSRLWM